MVPRKKSGNVLFWIARYIRLGWEKILTGKELETASPTIEKKQIGKVEHKGVL
ncbi:MAG: hypothetical protein M5T52_23830 [Ignavibacteriaceae bacterium]|nr:hypothetical protein [Ignavibacteriaceae bacterium]